MTFRTLCLVGIIFLITISSVSAEKVHDKLIVTVSERFRFVAWDDAVTLLKAGGERTFTRNRTRVGAIWQPRRSLAFGLALANEFRYYLVPEAIKTNMHEVFVDQLYVQVDKLADYPLSLKIGRQDLMFGEGFVVMDGGPLDGSRSGYFNAVRADWTFRRQHLLTLFAVSQEKTDKLLPIIHDQEQPMVEQPETAFGAYFSSPTLEVYYIYKRIDRTGTLPESHIHTIGARLSVLLTRELRFTAEGAPQFGDRGEMDRRAIGGYGYITYRPAMADDFRWVPASLAAGAIYLSGTDHDSDTWNDWDPLFSRWPKWSDSYIYTLAGEDRVAYWTNMSSLYGTVKWLPDRSVGLQFAYHYLSAVGQPPPPAGLPQDRGKSRGNLFIGKVTYEVNTRLTGHLIIEHFRPGAFYSSLADPYVWIRSELMFLW